MDIRLNDYKKVLAMDARTLKNLSDEDFTKALRAITTEAKRRKTRLKNTKTLDGTTSPAYRYYSKNDWIMPKDKNKAIIQIQQAKQFINNKTSTVKGYQEYQDKIRNKFNEKLHTNLSKKKFSRLTGILSTLSDSYDWYNYGRMCDSERQVSSIIEVVDMFKNKTDDEIIQILVDKHRYDYEIEQWKYNGASLDDKPLVPDSLKELYPKEYSENKVNEESDEESEDDSTKETIFK